MEPAATADSWRRLFPEGQPNPLDQLSEGARCRATRAAYLILSAHRGYLSEFNRIAVRAQDIFERRAWAEGVAESERRVRLYRSTVDRTWTELQLLLEATERRDRAFWMGVRQVFLQRAFPDYDADLALTF